MVRTPNLGSVSYTPNTPPVDTKDLSRYLLDELNQISAAINLLSFGHLDKTTVAPTKPRDGDLRYADGTLWNPGSGVGFYYYKGATSAWVFLG